MTEPEIILWSRMKNRQLLGCKFRRQYSVGSFVLDFYCSEKKLAIKVDGGSHFGEEAEAYDRERQSYIEQFGIRFLRFTNSDIRKNVYEVLGEILEKLKQTPSFRPKKNGTERSPLKKGEQNFSLLAKKEVAR